MSTSAAKLRPTDGEYIKHSGPHELADRPMHKPNRAVKLVKSGVDDPLFSTNAGSRILTVAKGIRFVSRGTVVLDLGFRVDNIIDARNRQREAAMEAMGFGISFVAVDFAAGIFATMALGPAGWIIAICFMGYLAYQSDELIKGLTRYAWDESLGPRKHLITWNRP